MLCGLGSATPFAGDERKRLREAAAAAEAAASANRLAWAMMQYRNSATNAAAEFVLLVSQVCKRARPALCTKRP